MRRKIKMPNKYLKSQLANYCQQSDLQEKKGWRRGIKTPQKEIIRKLFFKEINEGIAPKKVLKIQQQIVWPEDLPYKIMKTFVVNAGRSKNKKRVKRAIKFCPKKFQDGFETDEDDE